MQQAQQQETQGLRRAQGQRLSHVVRPQRRERHGRAADQAAADRLAKGPLPPREARELSADFS